MIALARKYRPKTFADVAVQSHVANTLRGAITNGRLGHGYLLCGPRGTGKTTLARVLAMALNCERKNESGEPCGECTSCTRIWAGSSSLDVVEIDAASNRGVDDARDLRERAMYAPSGDDRYKVYIVDEAHMLTREAWNALLKVLEEPPPRVVFIFATTEPHKIAQAAAPVLSRLQRFDLKRIGLAEIRQRLDHVLLAEGVRAEPDAVAMIARAADGSMRDALSLTDQALALGDGVVTAERVRDSLGLVPEDELIAILDVVASGRAADVFTAVERVADGGTDYAVFLAGLAETLRAQLAVELGGVPPDASDRMRDALTERRGRLAATDLLRMLNAIGELEPRFRRSGQQRLLIETLLVRLSLMDRTIALEEMLRGLAGAAGGGSDGGGKTEPRARPSPATPTPPVPAAGERPRRESSATPVDRVEALPVHREPRPPDPRPPDPRPPDPRQPEPRPPEPSRARHASPPDLNALTAMWDDVVADLRAAGRMMLATVLAQSLPVAVTAAGAVMVDTGDEAAEHAFESGKDIILAALRERAPGVTRIAIRREGAPPTQPARRITEESVREERIARLRKTDPVLAAAFDELDLDLLD